MIVGSMAHWNNWLVSVCGGSVVVKNVMCSEWEKVLGVSISKNWMLLSRGVCRSGTYMYQSEWVCGVVAKCFQEMILGCWHQQDQTEIELLIFYI